MNKVLLGAVAGFAATAPMTAAMELMHRQLPKRERYPLPPRQITMKVAKLAGIKEYLNEADRRRVTLAGHFGYGAAVGAVYGSLARRIPLPPVLGGVAFGLAVWTGSYLGWLPALGILPPATRQPPRRNGLMIAAHVVWGAATGALVEWMDRKAASRKSEIRISKSETNPKHEIQN